MVLKRFLFLVMLAFVPFTTISVIAQELTGPPANPKYKYSTQTPPGVAAPTQVETRLARFVPFSKTH